MFSPFSRALDNFRVTLGQRLPLFRQGRNKPSLYSSEDMNRLVQTLNALTNPQCRPDWAGKYSLSDSNAVLDLDGLITWIKGLALGGGGGGGTGNMNFRGLWDAGTAYVTNDVVYVNYQLGASPDQTNNVTRVLYICLSNNTNKKPKFLGGEATGDITYWRCLSFPTPILPMSITAISTTDLTCTDIFGNAGISVKIPFDLSAHNTSGVVNGYSWTYSAWSYADGAQTRTATLSGGSTMQQIIVRPYKIGQTIRAGMVYRDDSPNPVAPATPYYQWEDMNQAGRNWGKVYGT